MPHAPMIGLTRTVGLAFLCVACLAGCGLLKPALPVQVTNRPALTGEGMVLQLHNESGSRLVLELEIGRPGIRQTKQLTVSLGPDAVSEVGWLQGHAFVSGDMVVIRHDRHRTRSYTVP